MPNMPISWRRKVWRCALCKCQCGAGRGWMCTCTSPLTAGGEGHPLGRVTVDEGESVTAIVL